MPSNSTSVVRPTVLCHIVPSADSVSLPGSNGRSKKASSVSAALQTHVHDLSERVEVLAVSAKRREKAQLAKERATALARLMEVNKMQVTAEQRHMSVRVVARRKRCMTRV